MTARRIVEIGKRNWGLLIVLIAVAVITPALWFQLQPRKPNLPRYEYAERATENYYPGGGSCEPSVLAAIRDNRVAARERERCSEQTEEYRLKSDDLVQQARAADAAQAQAQTAYELAWMSVYATIGGFLTLIAAATAAFYARDAARHADKSAKATERMAFDTPVAIAAAVEANNAAREANEIAEKALFQDSRAWLKVGVEPLELKVEGDEPEVRCSAIISVTNLGSRPATNVGIAVEIVGNAMFRALDKQQELAKRESDTPPREKIPNATIFPGDEPMRQQWSFGTGPDALAELLKRFTHEGISRTHLPLTIIGCVQYRMPGSKSLHQTGFIYNVEYRPIPGVRGTGLFFEDLPLAADRLQLRTTFEGNGDID
jgi:hypothetical protein